MLFHYSIFNGIMVMEDILIRELNCCTVKPFGGGGGGCISQGTGYVTDTGERFFVKTNDKSRAKEMFVGELEGLKALESTHCVKVPKPHKVVDLPHGGAVLVVQYLDMHALSTGGAELGENLARLHLHNRNKLLKNEGEDFSSGDNPREPYLDKFGFDSVTCCGYLPQDNTWTDDWPTFYTKFRLQNQINRLGKDSELVDQWRRFETKLPHFFRGLDIFPSLLHGDLWSGNVASTRNPEGQVEPVIFDPAVVYGHHEFDLAISTMFGSLGKPFYTSYHKLIPKVNGFDVRQKLYQLYHYLNHYNHFGSGYRGSCIRILHDLCTVSL